MLICELAISHMEKVLIHDFDDVRILEMFTG